jgi:hypothetical protein
MFKFISKLTLTSMMSVLLPLLLLAATCSHAGAQITGALYGRVADSAGAVVPNASIKALNVGTGAVYNATSNSIGEYIVPSLVPGHYTVTVAATGFKTFTNSGIEIVVGENARVDASLEIGSATQSVKVSSNPIEVDTQSSAVGATIDSRRVEAMPLNGRNLLLLTQLLPGVGTANFDTQTISARSGPTVTVSGSRNSQNNILLDGTSMTEQMYNLGIDLPSPDALEEFRVLTNTYSAEYGRATGGVFLAVTKSGTNQFHGSLFDYFRNDALDARNYFSSTNPELRQNQFGGSVGGPVLWPLPRYNGRNRTFFFFSFQGTEIRQQTLNPYYPPTQLEKQGNFSASPTPIIDPRTGTPFPDNIIPQSRFDPMAANVLSTYVTALPNGPAGVYTQLVPEPTSGRQYLAKVDHSFNDSARLTLRFYRDLGRLDNYFSGNFPAVGSVATNLVQTEQVRYTQVLSPRLVNDAMFSHLRVDPLWAPGSGNQSPKELGGNYNYDGPYPLGPNLDVNGRFNFSPQLYFEEPEDTFQVHDRIAWTIGRHTIAAGVEIQRLQHATRAQFPSGASSFDGSFTGNPMADYLLGKTSNFFEQSFLEDESRGGNYHFFAQDDFKVTPRLTLNLGLRYELNTPWVQVNNVTAAVRPGQQSTVFPTAPPGLVYPGDKGIPRGIVYADKTNFAPRVGFAFDPKGDGRTAIRGAYGVFYNYTGAIISSNLNQAEPFNLGLSFTPPVVSDPFGAGTDPFPYKVNLKNPQFVYPLQAYTLAADFSNGRIQQYNLNVQHQFGSNLIVQVGYVGNIGRKLPTFHGGNQAVYTPGATPDNIQSRRPYFPQYFAGIGEETSDSSSSYNSLQISANKRFARHYTAQLAYTYSKSIDNNSTPQLDGTTAQNGNNYLNGERGLSDFDQRHILALNAIWQIPYFETSWLLGGWQTVGTYRIASGLPFSVLSGCDCALVGGGEQRTNVLGNPNLDPGRPVSQRVTEYFNTAAFSLPPTGQFGNSPRNMLIGPRSSQMDFSLQKRFRLLPERGAVQVRVDAFNLLNKANFANPNNTFLSPGFGSLNTANAARILQLALRYEF